MNKQPYNKEKFKNLVSKKPSGFIKAQEVEKADIKNKLRSFRVALNILEILENKEMSQAALADKVGVTAQQISKWLRGKSNMTLETIEKLENALGYQLIEICIIDFEREARKKDFIRKDFRKRIIKVKEIKQTVRGTFSHIEGFSSTKLHLPKSHTSFQEAEENLQLTGS